MKNLFILFIVGSSFIAFSSFANNLPDSNYEESIILDPQFSYFPGRFIIENKKEYDKTLQGYNFPFSDCFIPVDINSKSIRIDNEAGKITLIRGSFEEFKIYESENCFSERVPQKMFAISSKDDKSSFLGYSFNKPDNSKISFKYVDKYTQVYLKNQLHLNLYSQII